METPNQESGAGAPRAGHLIVGIGASAGGLSAFQAFFAALPPDTGMAFVLVQHLDPDYDSALAEIIGDSTSMPVTKAVDGTVAAPNTVSVIPPNAILRNENGILRVAAPETPTARRSSVDTFLVSLAQDEGENGAEAVDPDRNAYSDKAAKSWIFGYGNSARIFDMSVENIQFA